MWRSAASAQQQPDRGEDEHLLHHLDTEELLHHLDVEELVHHLDIVELRVHLDVQGQVERKAWMPERGEHEHLVHHLDVADAPFSPNGCRWQMHHSP